MGADGPGKAEIAVEELARGPGRVDEWEQASHNGDVSRAVEAGRSGAEDVAELGRVLLGEEAGRGGRARDHRLRLDGPRGAGPRDRGAVYERYRSNDADPAFAGLTAVDLG